MYFTTERDWYLLLLGWFMVENERENVSFIFEISFVFLFIFPHIFGFRVILLLTALSYL
jgi:hypothetical protein